MGGGLMQLVAYGAQDIYLTGNPQITFFKVVYRRHTNFSMEAIQQSFNGTPDFGRTVNCNISRNGDLIHRIYLQATLPTIEVSADATPSEPKAFRWLNWLGHILIKNVEIEIGGQRIDKHYGDWLHIWNELTQKSGHASGYAEMVGNVPRLTQIYYSRGDSTAPAGNDGDKCIVDPYTLYIPLQFWFCRNPGLALPLIALQYHDVRLNIEFRSLDNCIWARKANKGNTSVTEGSAVLTQTSPDKSLTDAAIWVDYIYLDVDERRRFAQVAHEYLIEQLQFTGDEPVTSISNNIKLNFTHPVKELVWIVQKNDYITSSYTNTRGGNQWFNYTDKWDNTFFTGTPENAWGPGLVGGRGPQNAFYGLPAVPNIHSETSFGDVFNYGKKSGPHMINTLSFSDLLATSFGNQIMSDNASLTTGAGVIGTEPSGVIKLSSAIDPPPELYFNPGIWGDLGSTFKLTDLGMNPIHKAKLQLNGHDRFSEREGTYFNLVQPYQHHENCPAPGINVYSFGLTPEDHQPSGTANFSRIDNATLVLTLTANSIKRNLSDANPVGAKVRVYATNYNILRIMSGMGGLAYSN